MAGNNNDTEKRLWDVANELRANSGLKASEYSVPVLEQYDGGVAVPTLNRNDVHRIEVLHPPEPILKLFEKYVTPMYQQIEILKKQKGKLEKARDLLLPKLISGEIDVSDLDIHIRNEFQES